MLLLKRVTDCLGKKRNKMSFNEAKKVVTFDATNRILSVKVEYVQRYREIFNLLQQLDMFDENEIKSVTRIIILNVDRLLHLKHIFCLSKNNNQIIPEINDFYSTFNYVKKN